MKRRRGLKPSTIILIVGSFIGLSLVLYPSFSDYWNQHHATHIIDSYNTEIQNMDESIYQSIWEDAVEYNRALLDRPDSFTMTDDEEKEYESLLHVGDTNIMGYIDIPKMNLTLPIYHSVSDQVLQVAIGHIPWSSLPTGGKGTHCVLSGHRGLQSAKLFTDLDLLKEGDIFMIRVLNELMTYEVDQIRVVEPNDASDLTIDPEKDYCTLVTCTPYGVNSHRLLVRGHRVENTISVNIVSEAILIDRVLVGFALAAIFTFFLILFVMFQKPKPPKQKIHYKDISSNNSHNL